PDEHHRRDDNPYERQEGRGAEQQAILSVECVPHADEIWNGENYGEPNEDVPGEERGPERAELGEGCIGLRWSRREVVGSHKRRDHKNPEEEPTKASQSRIPLTRMPPRRGASLPALRRPAIVRRL